MSVRDCLQNLNILTLLFSVTLLAIILRRGAAKRFPALTAWLACQAVGELFSIPLLFFRRYTGFSLDSAYALYFYSYWIIFLLQSALSVAVIYNVFDEAMRPLKGIHEIGKVVFRWIAVVSAVFAFCLAVGPHLVLGGKTADVALLSVCSEVRQGLSVLAICLMLFVCFAIRPLGLTYRSRVFGVSLGLGIYSTISLVEAAWMSFASNQTLYSPVYLVSAIGSLIALSVWTIYFASPEPARGMIMLPTTSPYFFWNHISEVLGDDPGHVVIAGFTPDMMAPGELVVATEMSKAATARERHEARQATAYLDEFNSLVAS